MTTLLVVDTETGGLNPKEACIIDIAAAVLVVTPGKISIQDTFEEKIYPDRPVSEGAAKCNGYTFAEWQDYKKGEEVLKDFRVWVEHQCKKDERPIWTGCNPTFDIRFYNSDRKRFKLVEPRGLSYRVLDVGSMAVHLLFRGEVENLKLATLRTWAGCEGEQTHTAMGDVYDTCEVIGALLRERIGDVS